MPAGASELSDVPDPPRPRPRPVSAARPAGARRTVTIRGQVAPPRRVSGAAHPGAYRGPVRRRPSRGVGDRMVGGRPDRLAMWAVLMGVFLILVAVTSAHAAARPSAARSLPAPAPHVLVAPAASQAR